MTVSLPNPGDGHQAIVDTYVCPTCGAEAGELCDVVDGHGEHVRMLGLLHIARGSSEASGRGPVTSG